MRILLVEDQPKLVRLLQKGLREEGVTADVAVTGLDGVWLATEQPYDVVVLDVMLPDVDGWRCAAGSERSTTTPRS